MVRTGNIEAAEQIKDEYVKLGISPAGVNYQIGTSLYYLNSPKEAALYFRKALESDPNYIPANTMLIGALVKSHDTEAAKNAFLDANKRGIKFPADFEEAIMSSLNPDKLLPDHSEEN